MKPNIFQSTKFRDQSIVIYGSISESKIGSRQLLQESWTVEILSTIVIYSGAINVSIRMARSTQYLGKEKQKTLCQKGYIEPNLCYCECVFNRVKTQWRPPNAMKYWTWWSNWKAHPKWVAWTTFPLSDVIEVLKGGWNNWKAQRQRCYLLQSSCFSSLSTCY